jgi:hypothetical protein
MTYEQACLLTAGASQRDRRLESDHIQSARFKDCPEDFFGLRRSIDDDDFLSALHVRILGREHEDPQVSMPIGVLRRDNHSTHHRCGAGR